MTLSFDLIEQPWIPCLLAGDRSRQLLGLRETLARAPTIAEIADNSPLVTIALQRLLLAILHRNFGPSGATAWQALWAAGHFDDGVLAGYFARWRPRFDLFADDRPFYQNGELNFSYAAPISRLRHDLASGNNATLFDHTTDAGVVPSTPDQAARDLVAQQAFAMGGRITFEAGQNQHGSADAAPLSRGALVLVRGANLFQTLLLGLHPYSQADEQPFAFSATEADLPAWERDLPPQAEDRTPSGYLDLLTWPSRRVRLQAVLDQDGRVVVPSVVIMKGNQFPNGWHRFGHETMVAFTVRERAGKNEDPYPSVGLREDRALWRDSLALLETGGSGTRPKTLTWLSELVFDHAALDPAAIVPLDVFGLCGDRAKVLLWRHERLPLPLALLRDERLLAALREALTQTEATAEALGASGWLLARLLLAPASDDPSGRSANRNAVRTYVERLGLERAYWSRLELPFRRLLVDLAQDRTAEDGELVYGRQALPSWQATLRRTARQALQDAASGLDRSGRALKAVASAERDLTRRLAQTLGPTPSITIGRAS